MRCFCTGEESDATTPAREEGLQAYGARYCFGWRSEGVQGASGKPPAFLPEYLYPVGFSANYGPKGTGGNEGKRVPSGHNRRRRLATRSSGKQQAERTAVRTAPIVCPEESPQCARRRIPLPCPRWGLTRRHRREGMACSPMGRSHFSFGGERKVCKRKPAARRLREKGFYCPF